jgi:hypothetical protein
MVQVVQLKLAVVLLLVSRMSIAVFTGMLTLAHTYQDRHGTLRMSESCGILATMQTP